MAFMGGLGAGPQDPAWGREVIPAGWQSARCGGGECAEVKIEGDRIYVRSSLNHQLVTFTKEEWDNFKNAIKDGEFDQ